jgi:hypothetical protein
VDAGTAAAGARRDLGHLDGKTIDGVEVTSLFGLVEPITAQRQTRRPRSAGDSSWRIARPAITRPQLRGPVEPRVERPASRP